METIIFIVGYLVWIFLMLQSTVPCGLHAIFFAGRGEDHGSGETREWTRAFVENEVLKATAELRKGMEDRFPTRKEFEPVRMIAFGFVGLVAAAAVGAWLALIWKTK